MTDTVVNNQDPADFRHLLEGTERILCDLDGCLIQDGRAIEGAADFVSRYQEKFRILTNNSTDTPETLANTLSSYGITLPPEQIILAGTTAVNEIANQHPGASLTLLASPAIRAYARSCGLTLIDGHNPERLPDLVLICRDVEFSYDDLQHLIYLISQDVPYYAANPDLTHPGRNGWPVIETGLIMNFIQQATGRPPKAIIGKPEAGIYHAALDGIDPAQAVMIGDNPKTDMAGAAKLGMPGIQVGPDFLIGALL